MYKLLKAFGFYSWCRSLTATFGAEGGESKAEFKTGALCCIVASRPLVTTKSPPRSGRDVLPSRQDEALQWRTNLSFLPAVNTGDGLDQDTSDDESRRFGLYSSTSRRSETLESCFQQSPRWASASGGIEQDTVPITYNSKPQCLDGVSWSSYNIQDELFMIDEPCTSLMYLYFTGEKYW